MALISSLNSAWSPARRSSDTQNETNTASSAAVKNSGSPGAAVPSGSGVFAVDVGAETLFEVGREEVEERRSDSRSEILACAFAFVASRIAVSWEREKDHSLNCDDSR